MGPARKIGRRKRPIGMFLMMSIIVSVAVGCQGTLSTTYKGARVLKPSLIALPNGVQQTGHFQAPDVKVDYQFSRQGDELDLWGTAEYTPGLLHTFTNVQSFSLSVLLTDPYGNVLGQQGIRTPGSDDLHARMHFSETFKLPPQTANMTFIYAGQGYEGEGSMARGTSFWHTPLAK